MYSILIVDPSEEFQAQLKLSFEAQKKILLHPVLRAEDVFKMDLNHFSLLVLGWSKEVIDAPQIVRYLRYTGVKVPILVATADYGLDDISLIMALGATDFMMKPYRPEILLEKVALLIKNQ